VSPTNVFTARRWDKMHLTIVAKSDTPPLDMSDQAALGPDGQLPDASKIAWYNADDPTLSRHLEKSKMNLFNYFNENYANLNSSMPSSAPSTSVQTLPAIGSPQKSFTA
jgi:hypothetical protein